MNFYETLKTELDQLQDQGQFRELRNISYRSGKAFLEGKELLNLSSNDYLGLSGHPQMIAAAQKAMEQFGTGSCASRLLSGSLKLHHILEEKTAAFKNK